MFEFVKSWNVLYCGAVNIKMRSRGQQERKGYVLLSAELVCQAGFYISLTEARGT